jgi:membrane protease subunit (stomatin/prohibitin family)
MEKNKYENIKGIKHLEERNEIERKAMEIAIEEERKENRKVIVVSEKEHYDILSIGNNPEDIRYIEVKGHMSTSKSIFITLKEKEFDFGKEHGDKYWIYLINMIEDKGIKILKIKDPINKLEWIKERIDKKKRKKLYLSSVYGLLNNNINENNLKIVSLEKREYYYER